MKILVSRLQEAYRPFWIEAWTEEAVTALPPKEHLQPDLRDESYDLGRVHYFLLRLRKGEELDPISVDVRWGGGCPQQVVLEDGHHRYAAYILARREKIPAEVGGPVDMIRWLAGSGKKPGWI